MIVTRVELTESEFTAALAQAAGAKVGIEGRYTAQVEIDIDNATGEIAHVVVVFEREVPS